MFFCASLEIYLVVKNVKMRKKCRFRVSYAGYAKIKRVMYKHRNAYILCYINDMYKFCFYTNSEKARVDIGSEEAA